MEIFLASAPSLHLSPARLLPARLFTPNSPHSPPLPLSLISDKRPATALSIFRLSDSNLGERKQTQMSNGARTKEILLEK